MPSEVIWYHSDEAGAPVLNNAAGALVNLLDACLVNGFNSKSITINVASDIATATASAHGYEVGKKVLIAGATPSGLNGVKKILSVATNTYTFDATGITAGAATGTITSKRAPLGWSIQYTGTNRRIYKRNEVTASAQMVRVDDRNTAPSSDMYARVYGVETATAIDTVGVRFPTNTQLSNGQYWLKGATGSTGAKTWALVGDGKSFYLVNGTYTQAEYSGADYFSRHMAFFGDINSYKSGDAYPSAIFGNENSGSGSSVDAVAFSLGSPSSATVGARAAARSHVGTGGAQGVQLSGVGGGGYLLGNQDMPLAPNPVDSGTLTLHKPIYVFTMATSIAIPPLRGEMPGLAQVLSNTSDRTIADRTLVTGATGTDRDFLILRVGDGSIALAAFDITGPWW
jgi:hypothetical protein